MNLLTPALATSISWSTAATGTHQGEFNGIEPTSKEFTVSDMGMYRVEDGKITELWIAADVLGLLVQLGVVELPK